MRRKATKVLIALDDEGKVGLLVDAEVDTWDFLSFRSEFVYHCTEFELTITRKEDARGQREGEGGAAC